MEAQLRKGQLCLVVFVLMLVIGGCASVKLIAEYDEQVDLAVTQFQRKMESFLILIERNAGKEEMSHVRNTDFYDEVRVDLSAISVRVAAIPDNDITMQQLALLSAHIGNLEKLHQLGINANDIPPIRTAFNVSCTAILKLELAKKRGNTSRKYLVRGD